MREPIPALMYHSVGPEITGWRWNFLRVPLPVFSRQLDLLAREGYRTVTWGEIQAYLKGEIKLPHTSIALTFDDGYLDNWSFVAPLLKRHGMKGIVFVSGEFIDPSEEPRPSLNEAWGGKHAVADVPHAGFLNRAEIRELAQAGPLEIGSHAMTHTWYPAGPEITGYYGPLHCPYWMSWNVQPDRKPFYQTDPLAAPWVAPGTPVFRAIKALAAPRFFPDPEFVEYAASLGRQAEVNLKGGMCLGLHPARQWEETTGRSAGRHETREEFHLRSLAELQDSKTILEKITGKRVDFFVWPGGGAEEESLDLPFSVGYSATTRPSHMQLDHWNRPGDNPAWLRRTGCGYPWTYKGRTIPTGHQFLLFQVQKFKRFGRPYWRETLAKVFRVPLWFIGTRPN